MFGVQWRDEMLATVHTTSRNITKVCIINVYEINANNKHLLLLTLVMLMLGVQWGGWDVGHGTYFTEEYHQS